MQRVGQAPLRSHGSWARPGPRGSGCARLCPSSTCLLLPVGVCATGENRHSTAFISEAQFSNLCRICLKQSMLVQSVGFLNQMGFFGSNV